MILNKGALRKDADRKTLLKVAFLSYGYGIEELGLGKYSWYLAHELRKLGVHVDVFTTKLHLKSLGPPLFYLRNMSLKLKNYDIIHSNEGAGIFLYHPCMVETYHHDYKQTSQVNNLIFYMLETLQCHKAKHIIVPSSMTKQSLLHDGFKEDKIAVIHHGVDHELFRPDEPLRRFIRERYGLKKPFVAISVGRLVRHKRHRDVIEALSKIPDTTLILVGEGNEEKRIAGLAEEKNVRLLHFKNISDEFLASLYNMADVYVHASILEGFGLTVLEAMASALPIVCYDVADFKDIVCGAGVLLKPKDVGGMVHAIEFLKERRDKRKAFSKAALHKSMAFNWKKTAEEHLKVYCNVLTKLD